MDKIDMIAFREAIKLLRDLADMQNGPPLERYRIEWEETMERVYDFLNSWENISNTTSENTNQTHDNTTIGMNICEDCGSHRLEQWKEGNCNGFNLKYKCAECGYVGEII